MRNIVTACVLGSAFTLAAASDAVSKAEYMSISILDMVPLTDEATRSFSFTQAGATVSADGCFATSLDLPNGAVLKNIKAYYKLNPSRKIDLTFLVRQEYGSSGSSGTGTALDNDSGNVEVKTIRLGNHVIDNKKYSYSIGVCIENGDGFLFPARLKYKLPKK